MLTSLPFSDLEAILSEIIVGNAFGVDRMDYLLRDSLHAGVAYGRFDHFRLIDTLRILPPPGPDDDDGSSEPQLGVEEGGLHSAEALLLARYFMFTQVYYHPVRRIYDVHLQDFLRAWLPGSCFPIDTEAHLAMTDVQVLAAMSTAARDSSATGHEPARRIIQREHFKVLWQYNPLDVATNTDAGQLIYQAACKQFGDEAIRHDDASPREGPGAEFPVLLPDGRVSSAQATSAILQTLPNARFDYVFVNPDILDRARIWLRRQIPNILGQHTEE